MNMKISFRFFYILPFVMVIGMPWLILGNGIWTAGEFSASKVFAILLFALGLIISFLSQRQVYKPDQWTKQEVPFDEPNRLVVKGIYRYSRNPMMVGLYLMLFSEALFFKSWALFYFLIFVVMGSVAVIMFVEEPRLEKKFGDAYRKYKKDVYRFIPKLF